MAILPRPGGDPERLLASLEAAKAVGLGDLAAVEPLDALEPGPEPALLGQAARAAAAGGFDWLLAVGSDETLAPDIFVKIAPALRIYDAVWGGAALSSETSAGSPPKVERITRLAAQDLPTFFHAALRWWIGPSHFVRPAFAADAAAAAGPDGAYGDYLDRLWRRSRAYKTAQALTFFEDEVPPVPESDRQRLVDILEEAPVFIPVRFDATTYRLPYTGLNPLIEREQMRGLFFEQEELLYLADRLPRGLRIVDVGANTGNHTVFFAGAIGAETVVPIEPLPRAVAAIRAAVAENRLANVDLSHLGIAVGAGEGHMRHVTSMTAGLGATRYAPDPAGNVALLPLDKLVSGRVDFLKIDVEGMEMEVLSGAAGLIAANRPSIHVEVLDATVAPFMQWVDAQRYRIERLFPDKTHCNYFLVPTE